MRKQITYTDAMAEVEAIVQNLEAGSVSIDDLAANVRRATELIGICRGHLQQADREVDKALAQLRDAAPDAGPPAQEAPCPPAPGTASLDDEDPFAS